MLELLFLKKNNLGRLWNVDSNTTKALGLSDESENL